MKITKNNFIFLIFFSLTILLINYFRINYVFFNLHMDTAGAIDLINNLNNFSKSISSIWSSNREVIPILTNPEVFCLDNFYQKKPTYDYNLLKSHSWYIIYPLSFILNFGIDPDILMKFLVSLSFSGTLIFVLFFVTKRLNIFYSLAIFVLIYFWPPIYEAINGQIYFSKLFILPGLLLIYFFEQNIKENKKNYLSIILLTLVCSLIHERATFFIGLYFLYSIFYEKRLLIFKEKKNLLFIFLGIVLIYYCFYYLNEISVSPHSGNYSFSQILLNLNNIFFTEHYRSHTIKMFAIIIPTLLLGVYNFKFFLLCLIFLAPNILTTIGGNEKIGWSVHYFSFFLPFAIYCIATGFVKLVSKYNFSFLLIIIITLNNFFIDPYNVNDIFDYKLTSVEKAQILKNFSENKANLNKNEFMKNALKILDNKKSISILEEHAIYFAGKEYLKISFFPIGVKYSDYLITSYLVDKENQEKLFFNTFINDKEIISKSRDCLDIEIKKNYNVVLEKKLNKTNKYILYEKK